MTDSYALLESQVNKLEARIAELESQRPSQEEGLLLDTSIKTAKASIADLCASDSNIAELLTSLLPKYQELFDVSDNGSGKGADDEPRAKLNTIIAQRASIYATQNNMAQLVKSAPNMPSLEQSQALASKLPTLESLESRASAQQDQIDKIARQAESLLMQWYELSLRPANQTLSHLGLEKLAADIARLARSKQVSY